MLLVNNLINAVVEHTNSDGALACSDSLGRTRTTLGVLRNVLIKVNKILNALIVTVLLNNGVDDQLCSTGSVVVRRPNKTLVFRIDKIFVILRNIKLKAPKLFLIVQNAQDALINSVPVLICTLELVGNKVRRILWLVLLKKTL